MHDHEDSILAVFIKRSSTFQRFRSSAKRRACLLNGGPRS